MLITFDLTSFNSLLNVKSWFNEYIQVGADLDISCILIGNKEDLMYDIPVELMEKIELSKEFIASYLQRKVNYFLTRVLSGFNVDSAFS